MHIDLRAIISFYAENIEFRSPKIKVVYPDNTNATIYNRKDLKYFSLGSKKFSKSYVMPIDFIVKGNNILLEYHGLADNKIKWSVIEKFELKDGVDSEIHCLLSYRECGVISTHSELTEIFESIEKAI